LFLPSQARVGIPPVRPGREVLMPPLGLEVYIPEKWDNPSLEFPGPTQTNKEKLFKRKNPRFIRSI